MRSRSTIPLVVAVLALAGCKSESSAPPASTPPAAATTGTAAAESWLDREEPTNWNAAGQEIPRPKAIGVDDATKERCGAQNRPVSSPEDNAVMAAGWTLFGPLQTFGAATMVSAMTTVDVNCHPVGMQTFVFRDGKFAGTVSPTAMDSLTDGAQRLAFLVGEANVSAEFGRYRKDDRPCCPSRFASVGYDIEMTPEGPLLVPRQVRHREGLPTPAPK